ncbi:MAG: heat-inducible transcriptional repressor HrcA [Alphaproteobacteria bacterium]|nr:heat-inducible transcriptional repressor HrcA [Alphaproteobacteria bacterium]
MNDRSHLGFNPVPPTRVGELSERSRDIFRSIVESYLDTGEPIGSRTLSQRGIALSPASIRNVMSDLEAMGLLRSPHSSAGRVPTQAGLRLFVDGLLEVGNLGQDERRGIEAQLAASGRKMEDMLTQATTMLSGLSQCAGLVVTPKRDPALKHVEFVPLGPQRALVIIVGEDGTVENRAIETPLGLPPSAFVEATNYLSSRMTGRTLEEARREVLGEIEQQRAELDGLATRLVSAGLAEWSGTQIGDSGSPLLIVRGQARLLEDVTAAGELERIRQLFDDIERKNDLIQLLDLSKQGEGVRIFIGSETNLFSLSGSSVIVSPYTDQQHRVVGVVGVIGPTRVNYARIVPMVDFTAKVLSRLLSQQR